MTERRLRKPGTICFFDIQLNPVPQGPRRRKHQQSDTRFIEMGSTLD